MLQAFVQMASSLPRSPDGYRDYRPGYKSLIMLQFLHVAATRLTIYYFTSANM